MSLALLTAVAAHLGSLLSRAAWRSSCRRAPPTDRPRCATPSATPIAWRRCCASWAGSTASTSCAIPPRRAARRAGGDGGAGGARAGPGGRVLLLRPRRRAGPADGSGRFGFDELRCASGTFARGGAGGAAGRLLLRQHRASQGRQARARVRAGHRRAAARAGRGDHPRPAPPPSWPRSRATSRARISRTTCCPRCAAPAIATATAR